MVAYDYQLTRIIDTVGRAIDFSYNTDGRLVSVTDFAGRTVSFTYDPATNDLLSITKPATAQYPSGVSKSFAYDGDHKVVSVTDARGETFVSNTYDADGRVETQTLGDGVFAFDYGVNQTTVTDRNGTMMTFDFDAEGHVTRKELFTRGVRPSEPASYVTTFTYNADGLLTRVARPGGNGTVSVYDETHPDPRARGNLLQTRRKANVSAADDDTNDIVTRYTYEARFNKIKTMTDPKGNVYTWTYDHELSTSDSDYALVGNPVRVELPAVTLGTPEWTYRYNAYGQPTRAVDPNGNVTELTYFADTGYLKSVTRDPGGISAARSFTYDAYGNIDTITDANNHVTDLDINALGWLTQATDPLGYETRFHHDENGNVVKVEAQADDAVSVWQTTLMQYDALNNLTQITDPLNRVTTFAHDANENMIRRTDAEGNTTTYVYDERDLIYTVTDANTPAGVTTHDYDTNGNLVKITDAAGNPTEYGYDGFDRRERTTWADGTHEQYAFDKNGNLTTHTRPSGDVITRVFDDLNRMTRREFPNTLLNETFGYDLGSRLTSANNVGPYVEYGYDTLNRVRTTDYTLNANRYTLQHTYDKTSNRTRLEYPSGKILDYTYDDNDRLTIIKEDSTTLAEYTYDPLSRITQRTTGTALQTDYAYDIANQLDTLTHTKVGGPQIGQFAYTHDNVGNRLSMAAPEGTHTYGYNDIYELESVTGASSHTYDYDTVGNRVTADGNGYSANALNQYTQVNSQTLSYDTNGNLTDDGERTLTYDPANRLSNASYASTASSYTFDAFNRRIAKTVDGQKTWFIHDGHEAIAEYSNTGGLEAEYIAGVGLDEWLVMDNGLGRYYYAEDGRGSARYLTDTAGNVVEQYEYDPYGKVSIFGPSGTPRLSSDANNPYLFTGRRFDEEIGLYHYRNRGYHPELGRFLQRDPLGYVDSLNIYQYVLNQPINYGDPYGLIAPPWANSPLKPVSDTIGTGESTYDQKMREYVRLGKRYERYLEEYEKAKVEYESASAVCRNTKSAKNKRDEQRRSSNYRRSQKRRKDKMREIRDRMETLRKELRPL